MYKGIRYFFFVGLSIPNEKCWLEVDGVQVNWKDGDCIVFDDSFEHSAHFAPKKNFTTPRAVLLLDFWHPQITSDEKKVLLELLNPESYHKEIQ